MKVGQALKETGLKSLYERRDEITSKLFIDACNTEHKLNKLLPKKLRVRMSEGKELLPTLRLQLTELN
mgnify:FL=1